MFFTVIIKIKETRNDEIIFALGIKLSYSGPGTLAILATIVIKYSLLLYRHSSYRGHLTFDFNRDVALQPRQALNFDEIFTAKRKFVITL